MTTKMIQNLSDEQLVLQFQNTKNNQFFGEIYNRHYSKVFYTCLGVVKDRETAADLAQDVMIKVMEKLPLLRNGSLLGWWIHRIAKNHSIDFYRERQNHLDVEDRFHMAAEADETEACWEKETILCKMEEILSHLEEDARNILTLKYIENYSIKALQKILGVSESAVKMRLSRARARAVNLYQSQPTTSAVNF